MSCYAYEGTWYVRDRHDPGCDPDCSGCQRCTERHCESCRKHGIGFSEANCPECIGKVRATLRAILDLYAALPDEAEVRGVNSEAAHLHGPAADPEAWAWRKAHLAKTIPWDQLPEDDEHHPLNVLGGWVLAIGEDYGDQPERTLSLSELVDYLDRRLGRIANDVGQDFGQFRREVSRCRAHLEAVLHDGEQRDTSRVPCLQCGRRLERRYGNLVKEDHHVCTNRECNRREYNHHEFVMAKRQWLEAEGADRHVKMQDARDAIERPKRTWNKWLRYWYVRSYRDPLTGQVWVWWPDVREMEQVTPRRTRSAA